MEDVGLDPAALKAALESIRRRDRFTAEIRWMLADKGFEDAQVVHYLEARGFLNDARVAGAEVDRLRRRGWGPEKIRAELNRRGAPDDLIVDVGGEDSMADAISALAKKFSHAFDRTRAIRFLLSRGFEAETAESAVDDYAASSSG